MVNKKTEDRLTAPERRIEATKATETDARNTGITTSEQPLTETDVPDSATLARGYYKWTDNDGNFRKVPIDGTTAIREPAHEQHELTVEDRDRLYEANALKTPRREVEGVDPESIRTKEIHNDEVHAQLAGKGVEAESADNAPITDGEQFANATEGVKVGTPAGPEADRK